MSELSRRGFIHGVGSGTAVHGTLAQATEPALQALALPTDGSTDCTDEFQQRLERDGTVFVPSGTFRVRDLVVPAGGRILGVGTNLYSPPRSLGSILRPTDGAQALIRLSEGAQLAGVTLDGETRDLDGVSLVKASRSCTIRNCNIQKCRYGIDGGYAGTVQITDCKIGRNVLGVRNLVDSMVVQCYIFGNKSDGIYLGRGANDNIISNNKIEWNGDANIRLEKALSNIVNGSIVDRSFASGLIVNEGDAVVSSCIFKRNGRNSGVHIAATSVLRLLVNGCVFKSGGDDDTGDQRSPTVSIQLFGSSNIVRVGENISGDTPLLEVIGTVADMGIKNK